MDRKKWIWFGAPLLAALSLGLGGCGDLSLYGALEGDGGGEFRLSPKAAMVAEGTAFTFEALGGFTPYNIAITGGLTAKDDHTWEFPPTTIAGATEEFVIEATDLLGNTASATITVYKPSIQPVLNEQAVTLTVGDSFDFTVASGTPPFTWTLDEVVQGTSASTYSPTFPAAGSYTVGVTDALGFYCGATVTVVSTTLVIAPTAAWVLTGGMLSFTAYGGDGSYDFSASAGLITDTNPAIYTAPGTVGTYTVTLQDGADPRQEATAKVIVVSEAPDPLALSPSGPAVSAVGDTIQFTASGGIEPYAFSTNKPDAGSIDPDTGFYTHLLAKKNVVVKVTDASGALKQTTVRWGK